MSGNAMFVLPPPTRPLQQYARAADGSILAPVIETSNVLSHPEEHFLAGDGAYLLKDSLALAKPPPHPSETPVYNPNPLATAPQPLTAGTKLSIVTLNPKPPPFVYDTINSVVAGGKDYSVTDHTNGTNGANGDHGRATSSDTAPSSLTGSMSVFGDTNPALASSQNTKDSSKRRKPKSSVVKSNSSLISRSISNDHILKSMLENPNALCAVININRAVQWLDLTSAKKAEYLTKVLFTKAHCICADINLYTKSTTHLDIIMGLSTGDIVWYEPISQRYSRINKGNVINKTPMSQIKWLPGSENLFVAGHKDGTLVFHDKEKEDADFVPEESAKDTDPSRPHIQILKSVHSKNQKTNPIAAWKLSNQQITDLAFSPDGRHLAVTSEDGSLRILDHLQEICVDHLHSWFGSLECVCWSPDGKYVVTGGHDDCLSIWLVAESLLVAVCKGHHSWVTGVAFDPWRCDDKNYRLGSVGLDRRLCLWDFSLSMLPRAKSAPLTGHGRGSVASRRTYSLAKATSESIAEAPEHDTGTNGERQVFPRPLRPRKETPELPPVAVKVVDEDSLCSVSFTKDAVITSCLLGHIRTWERPSIKAAA